MPTNAPPTIDPLTVDMRGLARLTGLSESYVAHNWRELGIPALAVGRRRLFLIADVKAWLKRQVDDITDTTTEEREVAHG